MFSRNKSIYPKFLLHAFEILYFRNAETIYSNKSLWYGFGPDTGNIFFWNFCKMRICESLLQTC